jgi:hypothetical protein
MLPAGLPDFAPGADVPSAHSGLRPTRFLAQSAIVLGTWTIALAVITLALEPVPTAAVLGPTARTIAALRGTDTRIVDAGPGYVIVRGYSPGFVRELYARGAFLVLPARTGGCLGERPAGTVTAISN